MKENDLIFGLMASFDKEAYTFDDLRHLTAPFDLSAPSLRTNLSRMVSAKLIQSERVGRRAYYRFADKGRRISANVSHGFTALQWDGWDGAYWGVIFSVPEACGENRHTIRKKLSKYRFACLTPGFWIRPLYPDEDIPRLFQNILSTGFCQLIRFYNYEELPAEQASAMWNLQEVNRGFFSGLALLDQAEKSLDALSPEQALVQKMYVGDAVVNRIFDDPLLPPRFLPPDWQGQTIRRRFSHFDRLATKRSKPYWEIIFNKEGAQ